MVWAYLRLGMNLSRGLVEVNWQGDRNLGIVLQGSVKVCLLLASFMIVMTAFSTTYIFSY